MKFFILLVFAFAGLGAQAADPYLAYVYPAGIQAGTTNRVLIGGQNFWGRMDAHVSGGGVDVLDVEVVPGFPNPGNNIQAKHLRTWLDRIAKGILDEPPEPKDRHRSEWRSNTWWTVLGTLGPLELELVERDLFVPKNRLQMSPALRQNILVTLYAHPDAALGPRSFVVMTDSASSEPRPFVVTAAPHVQEPRYVPPHRINKKGKGKVGRAAEDVRPYRTGGGRPRTSAPAVANFPCVLNGRVLAGETDSFTLRLPAGARLCCSLLGRELQPYIGDAVPGFFNPVLRLLDAAGSEVAFADDRHFHPDPVLRTTIPAAGSYTLEVRDNLFRGREDFVYAVAVSLEDENGFSSFLTIPDGDLNTLRALNALDGLSGESGIQTFSGALPEDGSPAFHELTVTPPARLVFDLVGRRAGSPVDAIISISEKSPSFIPFLSSWEPIVTFDDVTNSFFVGSVAQGECDPEGTLEWSAGSPRTVRVAVSDRAGKGGSDYFYTLRVYRDHPRFAVYSSQSAFALRPWSRIPVKFRVVRKGGFTNAVTLVNNEYVRFENARIPAASNGVTALVLPATKKTEHMMDCTIWAAAEIEGKMVGVPVVPCDEYSQAFAWDHLVPARAFQVSVRDNTSFHARKPIWPRLGMKFPDSLASRTAALASYGRLDADIAVIAPTNAAAQTAARALLERMRHAGWQCVMAGYHLQLSRDQQSIRTLILPRISALSEREAQRVVDAVQRSGFLVLVEDALPKGLPAIDFRADVGSVRAARYGKGRFMVGRLEDLLARAPGLRRESFTRTTGVISTARRKIDGETIFALENVTDRTVRDVFRLSFHVQTAHVLDPSTGEITPVPVKDDSVSLTFAPRQTLFLQSSPYDLLTGAALPTDGGRPRTSAPTD